MTQERLSDLGLLSIEKERFKDIDGNAIVRDFANAKARKVAFWLFSMSASLCYTVSTGRGYNASGASMRP